MSKPKIVKNNEKYYEFVRKLRNNKEVKKGFIQQTHISKQKHKQYMKKYGKNYYICLYEAKPVGYVGVINKDVRVAVTPNKQNKGVGLFMINYIKRKHKTAQAKIKTANTPSIKLFKKAGYKLKYYIYEAKT